MSTPANGEKTSGPEASAAGAAGADRLVAFTWNVHRNPAALDLACRYLATQGSFLAALQELPEDSASLLTRTLGENKIRLLSRPMLKFGPETKMRAVDPTVVLLASDDVEVDPIRKSHEYKPELDINRRLEGFTLQSKSWQGLQILGVHGWDRMSHPDETERSEWGVIMRDILQDFWDGGPLIVLGDLNAHPWSPEVTKRRGLYALRWKDWPEQDATTLANTDRQVTPLYNPMWDLLPDGAAGGNGSYFYVDKHDQRWHCFDQIIVSAHLREHISRPTVLPRLLDRDLLGEDEKPARRSEGGKSKPELSDHLPVQLTIDIGKVTQCKASASS
jgi:hypothetical protein